MPCIIYVALVVTMVNYLFPTSGTVRFDNRVHHLHRWLRDMIFIARSAEKNDSIISWFSATHTLKCAQYVMCDMIGVGSRFSRGRVRSSKGRSGPTPGRTQAHRGSRATENSVRLDFFFLYCWRATLFFLYDQNFDIHVRICTLLALCYIFSSTYSTYRPQAVLLEFRHCC